MTLRGPLVSSVLRRCGVDPKRYWLLVDLFDELSDRGEMLDQLGRNGVGLKMVGWIYFGLSAFIGIGLAIAQPTLTVFLTTFLFMSAILLLSVLLSETSNSLVNPVEGLVLAHQPIDGATYTAAKLSHLLRIILVMVPALDAAPALCGLFLPKAPWWYPVLHIAAAFAMGLVIALGCCAAFGWLMRFIPVRRLKAAGQLIGSVPFMAMAWMGTLQKSFRQVGIYFSLPAQPAVRWAVAIALLSGSVAAIILGIRSLSADYLIRVSTLVRGGAAAGSKPRRSLLGELVSRYFGGQPARGGFAFVSRLMLRDWQFRRQMGSLLFPAIIGIGSVVSGWRVDPFSLDFSRVHLFPHIPGVLLFLICSILPYGTDYKGAWLFRLVPSRTIEPFARGVHGLLWLEILLIPHLLLLPVLAIAWGWWHAALFVAYSLAAGSVYLALDLRMTGGAPFSSQVDSSRGYSTIAVMFVGGICVSIAVAFQYFVIFRWPAAVLIATVAMAVTAVFLTRASIAALATAIRFQFDVESGAVALYKEVGG
jgi:hypothetical protein